MNAWWLAAALAAPTAQVLAVRTEAVQGRTVLRVVTTSGANAVRVTREAGGVLSFTVPGAPGPDLRAPAALPAPLGAVRLASGAGVVVLRVEVPLDVPYEVRREGTDLLLLFGARDRPPPSPDVLELYRRILPPPADGEGGAPSGAAAPAAGGTESSSETDGGPLNLRPSVDLVYVNADGTFLDTPEPVRDRYFELAPRVEFTYTPAHGTVHASYGLRLRAGSTYSATTSTTHLADLSLDVPLGSRLKLRASDHFAHGLLETNEVDGGREYFFDLGHYTRNSLSGGLRTELGSGPLSLDLDLVGNVDFVTVDDDAGFFDHGQRGIGSGLRYQVNAGLEARLLYSFQEVPAPDERPLVASRAHTVSLALDGELAPLVTAQLSVGYRDQKTPGAGPGGQRFNSVVALGRLTKELSRAARLSLFGGRGTYVSGFEDDAFYVASEVGMDLTVPLPASLALRAGATYHWNDYRTAAAGLDEPRADRIRGLAVGLGRPVTRWAFVRVDYRKEFRHSNLDEFDTDTSAFTVQVGLGAFGASGWRP